uniref:Uncharacterized protein n=1 Tax=Steinernema glaseri TaxID=37863 RepID=A0A1I8AKB8_9BILA
MISRPVCRSHDATDKQDREMFGCNRTCTFAPSLPQRPLSTDAAAVSSRRALKRGKAICEERRVFVNEKRDVPLVAEDCSEEGKDDCENQTLRHVDQDSCG